MPSQQNAKDPVAPPERELFTPRDSTLENPPSLVKYESRPITTVFYERKKVIKTNHAKWSNKAVLNCVNHLQLNHYGATLAEIFDTLSGVLHAVLTYSVTGKITIIYKREVKEDTDYGTRT
jgi:hypothetical protein